MDRTIRWFRSARRRRIGRAHVRLSHELDEAVRHAAAEAGSRGLTLD